LKTARGHINGIVGIIEADAYCPDVMKQLSAVQGLLEGASRVMLRRHLETCVAKAMQEGHCRKNIPVALNHKLRGVEDLAQKTGQRLGR
jgi:DNA-binding FrmR family transcriptional regulator